MSRIQDAAVLAEKLPVTDDVAETVSETPRFFVVLENYDLCPTRLLEADGPFLAAFCDQSIGHLSVVAVSGGFFNRAKITAPA
ncbi:hypothetical protein [Agrobacterium tumefaciens]|uniref:hypothetical protein n=1 Tax=Agrobacterium tumefaciens TaxID=358 RepID=UPI0021D10576|nr:hypothetical protein [Agrobacterium tumefaciens]